MYVIVDRVNMYNQLLFDQKSRKMYISWLLFVSLMSVLCNSRTWPFLLNLSASQYSMMTVQEGLIPMIWSSLLLPDLIVSADSMQFFSDCYNFGLISVKWISLGRKTLMFIQRLVYLFGNAQGLKLIHNTWDDWLFVTFPQPHHNHYKTWKPKLKNGNLWLKRGSCSASSESGEKS